MLHFIGTAAILALAAASPAWSQDKGKGNDNGGAKGGGKDRGAAHAGMDHGGGGKPDKAARGETRGQSGKAAARDMREVRGDRDNDRIERVRDTRGKSSIERTVVRERGDDRRWDDRRGDNDGDWDGRDRIYASVPGCPPGLAKKNNGCLPPGLAKKDRDGAFGYEYRPALFGVPLRTGANYVYYDGFLIPVGGSRASYVPLPGGALAVGQMWPQAYPSLGLADWQRDYYGFDDPRMYRNADNVVYRVDPATAAIEAVAALLTGSDFNVGQRLPQGYDVYNVPAAYQDRYADNNDALYRYADGRVYEVDPTSMLIAKAIDLIL